MAPQYRAKSNGASQAQKKMMKQVAKGVLNSRMEHKVVSLNLAAAATATAGTVYPITRNIIEGDGENERSGTTINVESLRVTVGFTNTGASTVLTTQRIIVFSDSMIDGATPTVSQVLEAVGVYSGYNQINSQRNRFKVYVDKLYDQVGQSPNAICHLDHKIRLNKKVYYNAASGNNSDGKGAMYYLVIATVANAGITHTFGARIQYTDA